MARKSVVLLCVAASLSSSCSALQLSTRDVADDATAFAQEVTSKRDVASDSGFVAGALARLREDVAGFKAMLPGPASHALGFVQEAQEPGHLNPSYREDQRRQQARSDAVTTVFLQAVFMVIFALIYQQYKVRPEVDASFAASEKEKLNVEWESGYFACFNDMSICLVGCCCPLILWAENMSLVHILAFWTAVAIMVGIYVASAFIPIMGILTLAVMVWGRSKLRQKFNMNFNTASVFCEDTCCLAFCGPCVICQDARHLQAACKAGHDAVPLKAPEEASEN